LLAFLVIWLVIVIYLLGPLWTTSNSEERLAKKLHEAKDEITRLAGENYELRTLLKRLQEKQKDNNQDVVVARPDDLDSVVAKFVDGPSKEYEMTRRQISRDANELWWYIRSRLEQAERKFGQSNPELSAWLNHTLVASQHHQKAVLVDVDHLADVDGHADWRIQEEKELSALVEKRLITLQNPTDCKTAPKLMCNLNKGCGYGCQLHHVVYCFLVAYGTERTLILKSKGWRYNRNGFEEIFQPLSETCTVAEGQRQHWPGGKSTPVLEIPIIDSINPRPQYLPPAIPRDLADRIMRIHGDPIVWWVSRFLKYLLRPQSETAQMLEEGEKDIGLVKPIVGIHVRRTDKVGTEAAFHPVEEYMKHVSILVQT
jgi:glycoprotein 6-alpha-L-fucosyltransferase